VGMELIVNSCNSIAVCGLFVIGHAPHVIKR
jgi:hypothetical protein